MVWRVADELLYTRRVTDDTYREALAVLGERRLLSSATIAAYYEYVSMLLNVDRYPLPADAPAEAAAAAHGLRPLSADALYRKPQGAVTPRPPIPNEDTERAIAALGASVERDEELPARRARGSARAAVLRQWNRGSAGHDEVEALSPGRRRGATVCDGVARIRGSSPTRRLQPRSMRSASAASSTSWCSWDTRTFAARSKRLPAPPAYSDHNKENPSMKLRHLSLATATLCLFAGATAASAQSAQLPSDIDATSRARLPYVQRKDTDEQAKRLFDIFVRNSNSPTDQLGGPLGVRRVQRAGRQCTARSARWRRGQGHARRARARARDSRGLPRDELRLRVERPRAGGAARPASSKRSSTSSRRTAR